MSDSGTYPRSGSEDSRGYFVIMARRPYIRSKSMGSGQVVSSNRTIVHFGSPEGTAYSKAESSDNEVDLDDSWDDVDFFFNN